MDANEVLQILIAIAIVAFGFATGLATSFRDLLGLFRRPGLASRSLLALFVIDPAITLLMVTVLNLPAYSVIALVLLAISPGVPMVPQKGAKAGGNAGYAVSLVFGVAAVAVVVTPGLFHIIAGFYGRDLTMPVLGLARTIATVLLAPLLVGAAVRAAAPQAADRLAPLVVTAANSVWPGIGLIVAILVLQLVPAIGLPSMLAMVFVAAVSLFVGHNMGGPDRDTRPVLALASANRFPGLAIAIATALFPEQRLVLAAILVYFLIAAVISAVYIAWSVQVGRMDLEQIGPPMTPS